MPRPNLTRDHVVPKWVLTYFPEFRENRKLNRVLACRTCNHGKGSMPAAEFVRIRTVPGARKKAQKMWNGIIQKLAALSYTDPEYLALRRLIIMAFSEEVPGFSSATLSPIGQAMRRILVQQETWPDEPDSPRFKSQTVGAVE
jgi:hypothetical protein